jgi:hypothetical protein
MDIYRKPGSWNLAQYMTTTRDTKRSECLPSSNATETPHDDDSISSFETHVRESHREHTLRKLEDRTNQNVVNQEFVDALCYEELAHSDVNSGLDFELPYSPDQQISMDNVRRHGSEYFTSAVGRELGVINGTSSASIASVLPLPGLQSGDIGEMEDEGSTYGPLTVANISDDSFISDVPDIENLPGRYSLSQVRQDWAARHCVNPSAPGYVPSSAVSLLLVQTHCVVRRKYLAQEETAVKDTETWFTHRKLGLLSRKAKTSMETVVPTQSLVNGIVVQAAKLAASPLSKTGKKIRTVADKVDKAAEKLKKIAETGKPAE